MKKYAVVAALVEAFGLPEEINSQTDSEEPKATEENQETTPTKIPNMVGAARHLLRGLLD